MNQRWLLCPGKHQPYFFRYVLLYAMRWLQLQLPQQKCLLPLTQPHLTGKEAQASLAPAMQSLHAGTHTLELCGYQHPEPWLEK